MRVARQRGQVVELDVTAAAREGELGRAVERRFLARAFA
jgi:hypothetical protein